MGDGLEWVYHRNGTGEVSGGSVLLTLGWLKAGKKGRSSRKSLGGSPGCEAVLGQAVRFPLPFNPGHGEVEWGSFCSPVSCGISHCFIQRYLSAKGRVKQKLQNILKSGRVLVQKTADGSHKHP